MIRPRKYGWTAMTLVGLLAGAANADDGGLVRVSDSAPQPAGSGAAPAVNAGPAPGCDTGGNGGVVYEGDGGAVGRARLCGCLRAIIAYNPAAGFRPPESVPIDRDAVMYYKYWPAKWYGQPGWRMAPSFPMVYMPTDTTQLGVYYARVPQWQPNPRMYPRPPRPDEWNRRVVMGDRAGGGGGCGVAAEYAQPASGGGPTPDAVGTPAPQPATNLQPVPQQSTMPPTPKMAPPPAPMGN
jgi:hypothetical protein